MSLSCNPVKPCGTCGCLTAFVQLVFFVLVRCTTSFTTIRSFCIDTFIFITRARIFSGTFINICNVESILVMTHTKTSTHTRNSHMSKHVSTLQRYNFFTSIEQGSPLSRVSLVYIYTLMAAV